MDRKWVFGAGGLLVLFWFASGLSVPKGGVSRVGAGIRHPCEVCRCEMSRGVLDCRGADVSSVMAWFRQQDVISYSQLIFTDASGKSHPKEEQKKPTKLDILSPDSLFANWLLT